MKLRIALLVLIIGAWGCPEDQPRNPNSITTDPIRDMGTMTDTGDMSTDATAADSAYPRDSGTDSGTVADTGTGADMGSDMCIPETDAEMCARYMFECGPLQDLDNCGEMRTIDSCGDEIAVCSADESCGGGGTPGQCGCTIATCTDLGVLCGQVADTCGGTLDCDLFCVDEINAGDAHNCAIGSGKIKCWGNGTDGALGTGTTATEKNPVDVVGLTSTVTHVAAGGHHTCVIDSAQRVLCWGKNNRAQLGIGTTVDSKQPGMPAITSGADQIVAGTDHACARSGDKVECWGSNEFGQIGDISFNINANVGVPSIPDGLDANVVTVAAGDYHNCVIQNDPSSGQMGLLKCWGRNRYAQVRPLPINATKIDGLWDFWGYDQVPGWDLSSLVPTPVIINDAAGNPWTGVKAVAAGLDHTCIIDSADQVWCWGFMPGFDPATSCPKPDNKTPRECGVFPRTDGILVGRLNTTGDGLTTIEGMPIANEPRLIPTNKTPVELAAGDNHHCMRVSDPDTDAGNIYCWGNSAYGQIGDGTNNHWTDPRLVITDTNGDYVLSTQIELGGRHSCALVDNSNINCWGSNAKSQIGNSNLMRDESYRPFDVLLEVTP